MEDVKLTEVKLLDYRICMTVSVHGFYLKIYTIIFALMEE